MLEIGAASRHSEPRLAGEFNTDFLQRYLLFQELQTSEPMCFFFLHVCGPYRAMNDSGTVVFTRVV